MPTILPAIQPRQCVHNDLSTVHDIFCGIVIATGMTFRTGSIRLSQLKRHSLANITEAWRGVTAFRGGALSSLKASSASPLDFAATHEFLGKLQRAIIQLFQKRKLEEGELPVLQDNVRHLVQTQAGPLIYDYYKEKILLKGMVIIRDCLKNEIGLQLLQKLCEQWKYFYQEILPTLQAMLYPMKTTDLSIRQVTLLEFRDVVLLKLEEIEDALDARIQDLPSGCEQMLLVLQGLYTGEAEPSIKANANTETKMKLEEEPEEMSDSEQRPTTPSPKSLYQKSGNGLALGLLLAPVVEYEAARRHSIQS